MKTVKKLLALTLVMLMVFALAGKIKKGGLVEVPMPARSLPGHG